MEIRSRVGGSGVHVLRLTEDEPRVSLDELPLDIGVPETFTEIVMTELHETASRALSGRRLAEYLAQHAHRVPGAVEASEDVAAILALVERNLRGG